ncbi:MAG TPA: class I SAM-dependent methyltransferase [Chloroflexi bacterium]|nr:class I SAM-dependent methyltransferase [Chloroflexota bacterium]
MEGVPLDFRPNLWVVLKDFIQRAINGELHLPPWWLRDIGGAEDFEAVGQEFLTLFVQLAQLKPDEQVLEIGCGSGRMALPLTTFLRPPGSYTGTDIVAPFIAWCQKHISRRRPQFAFLHADLYNQRYNPQGRWLASEYTFPFPDERFDFVFLTSVFTHLLPKDTEHYLHEIRRLLRPNGRCLATFFLLNETQARLAAEGKNEIAFRYGSDPIRIRSETVPESAVAYDEAYLLDLLSQCGLTLQAPIYYGSWSGRADGLSYQDILLFRRADNDADGADGVNETNV